MHDPRKLLEILRDHLARHDSPLAFFLGAGASSSVLAREAGDDAPQPLIPAVAGMTVTCKQRVCAMGETFEAAWQVLEDDCSAAKEDAHIENVLSRVQAKLLALGSGDVVGRLNGEEWARVDRDIRRTIAKLAQPSEERFPETLPHDRLAAWIGRITRDFPVEIFTVNYDTLLERALEGQRIPVFDGFVGSHQPFFLPESLSREHLAPGKAWTRLWKIHGSINWHLDSRRRVFRGAATATGEMVFPSYRKYDESRKQPYVAFLDRLSRFLSRDDALLISTGYRFADQHINDIVFEALDSNPRAHLISLQFEEPADSSDLAAAASRSSNIVVVGPKTGIWNTIRSGWRLTEAVDKRTADLVDVGFDSDALRPDDPDAIATEGKMRLGDFASFCSFLDGMT